MGVSKRRRMGKESKQSHKLNINWMKEIRFDSGIKDRKSNKQLEDE